MCDHEGTLQNEYIDFTMKAKLILTQFGGTFEMLRFDEKSFLDTLMDITPYWVHKLTNAIHADSPGVDTN